MSIDVEKEIDFYAFIIYPTSKVKQSRYRPGVAQRFPGS
jgi:hypothetical protein